jgi:hypothetical protein
VSSRPYDIWYSNPHIIFIGTRKGKIQIAGRWIKQSIKLCPGEYQLRKLKHDYGLWIPQ